MKKHLLTAEQVQQLRSACDSFTPKGKRDIAILDTMLFQGLRLKEAANLNLMSFTNFGDQITIQLKDRAYPIKVHGTLHQSLKTWLDQRGIPLENTTGPVFVPILKSDKTVQKPLDRRTISHLVAYYGNLAGILPVKGPDRLTPGDLRRTCARRAYDHGANLLAIQVFLGFNHLETVVRYIGVSGLIDTASVIDQINYDE
jgi:site-specific recombinase XerD